MRPQYGCGLFTGAAKEHDTVQYKFQDVCLVYYLFIIKPIHVCLVYYLIIIIHFYYRKTPNLSRGLKNGYFGEIE